MAIDSEAKRWSMLGLANGPIPGHVVNPTGSDLDSIVEKLSILQVYGGLTEVVVATKYVEITLVSKTGTAQASLTALSWAWFDTDDIASASSPSDQGATETTDASAVINAELPNTFEF